MFADDSTIGVPKTQAKHQAEEVVTETKTPKTPKTKKEK